MTEFIVGTEERNAAEELANLLHGKTPKQARDYIINNVVNLATAKDALIIMAVGMVIMWEKIEQLEENQTVL